MPAVGLRECVRRMDERRKLDPAVPKISVSTLSRQVAAGIIPNHADDGGVPQVDVDEVIASRAHVDQSKQRGAASPLGTSGAEAPLFAGGDAQAFSSAPDDQDERPSSKPDRGGATYQKARTVRETIAARTAQLNLEEKLGNLVDRRQVTDLFFDLAASLREGLTSRAPLLAGRLTGQTDPSKITAAIVEEDRKLLERMAEEFSRRFNAGARSDAAA